MHDADYQLLVARNGVGSCRSSKRAHTPGQSRAAASEMDGSSCNLPACKSDADCETGELGSWCENAGDIALAKCQAPDPGEIPPVAPMEMQGWSELRITDAAGNLLADATSKDARIEGKDIPEDGIVRFGTQRLRRRGSRHRAACGI